MVTMTRLYQVTFAYAALLVALILSANAGILPVELLLRLPGGDKLGHFLLMGLLSFLVNLCVGLGRTGRHSMVTVCLGLTFLVGLEELSQTWLEYRRYEVPDLVADIAGIFVFGFLARLWAVVS